MKLEKFKEKDHKKKIAIGICIVLVLLIAGIMVYRSFAFYEEKKAFDVIKGQVPDQNYDLMFSFYIKDENGNNIYQDTMPEGKNYTVTVEYNNGATGEWDYEDWGPRITNLTNTRTKCKIYFSTSRNLIDVIKEVPIVTSGTGLYEVSHRDANITYTSNATAINNLKQTELRYAGSDPNNYVLFNNELWRMIGIVNTPEEQRIKLVRNESIGNYVWDTSTSTVNSGHGVSEWSQADLMKLLNSGYENEKAGGSLYWNRTSGNCYNGSENATISCDFSETGLTNGAKDMIDTITWNTGSATEPTSNWQTVKFYNYERSNSSGCNGVTCSDKVLRKTSWKGKVALIYPSDYGFATVGGSSVSRSTCLNTTMNSWSEDCKINDWLYNCSPTWFLTPRNYSTGFLAFNMNANGYVYIDGCRVDYVHNIFPSLYLKSTVNVTRGDGTSSNPWRIN